MATTVETVLSINAGNSAETLKGLRAEAKQYREQMNSAKVSSDEFNEAQANLNNTLAQIKNVLSLGTKEFQEANGSYNSLVRTMSQLTQAWRATGDEAERAALGKKILEINTQLKALDASRGNFQRNVGNYESAFNGLSTSMSQVIRELPSLQMGMSTFVLAISNNLPILFDNIQRVNAELVEMRSQGQQVPSTISAIAKSFMSLNTLLMAGILVLQAVVNNWDKIASLWRDKSPQELASEAIERMNEAIEKQDDLLKKAKTENLRKYSEALREVGADADKAREALEDFNRANEQSALVTAQNKLKEAYKGEKEAYDAYVAATSGRGIIGRIFGVDEDELDALQEALDEAKKEVINAQQEVAQAENDIAKGDSDRAQKAAERAEKAQGKRDKELAAQEKYERYWSDFWSKLRRESEQYSEEHNFIRLPDLSEFDDWADDYVNRAVEFNNKLFKQEKKAAERREKLQEKEKKARTALAVDMFAQIMGNTASLFEENTAAYKAFAIAEATIATYSSAVKSFEQLGGWPFGLIGIASSIAAGLAQVKNILSVDTSGKNTNVSMPSAPAIVSAPAVVQEVPITRTMLDAGQEARLNANIQDQRVYVVYSDIEGAGKRVNVQREESSF